MCVCVCEREREARCRCPGPEVERLADELLAANVERRAGQHYYMLAGAGVAAGGWQAWLSV